MMKGQEQSTPGEIDADGQGATAATCAPNDDAVSRDAEDCQIYNGVKSCILQFMRKREDRYLKRAETKVVQVHGAKHDTAKLRGRLRRWRMSDALNSEPTEPDRGATFLEIVKAVEADKVANLRVSDLRLCVAKMIGALLDDELIVPETVSLAGDQTLIFRLWREDAKDHQGWKWPKKGPRFTSAGPILILPYPNPPIPRAFSDRLEDQATQSPAPRGALLSAESGGSPKQARGNERKKQLTRAIDEARAYELYFNEKMTFEAIGKILANEQGRTDPYKPQSVKQAVERYEGIRAKAGLQRKSRSVDVSKAKPLRNDD